MSFADKFRLYGEELMFAARRAPGAGNKISFASATLRAHARNWRGIAADGAMRKTFEIDIAGKPARLMLRPNDGDFAIFHEIFTRDAYRFSESDLPPSSVMTIVDAGANIGLSALYFAARYPQARIICVEPNPDNFALLIENAKSLPRIQAIQACVTAHPVGVTHIDIEGKGSHVGLNWEGRGVAVKAMTMSELCDACGIDKIDLLKMDIEGAERDVFAHADFLDRTRAIVAELHGDYGLDQFNAHLAGSGLRAMPSPFARDPNIYVATRD